MQGILYILYWKL